MMKGEFNISIANIGSLMDRADGMSWGEGFWGRFGQSLYMGDKDIAGVRGLGFGVTFSREKAPVWRTSVAGGVDLTGVTAKWASAGLKAAGEVTGLDKRYNSIAKTSTGLLGSINKGLSRMWDKVKRGSRIHLGWSAKEC